SADARLLCQFENYLTDYFSGGNAKVFNPLPAEMKQGLGPGLQNVDNADVARLHFDALTSEDQVEYQWKSLEANTRAALVKWAADPSVKSGYRVVVLMTILGASLHAVQDFYSHSNWLKKVNAGEGGASLWFEIPDVERAKLAVKSGWYPDGTKPGVLY